MATAPMSRFLRRLTPRGSYSPACVPPSIAFPFAFIIFGVRPHVGQSGHHLASWADGGRASSKEVGEWGRGLAGCSEFAGTPRRAGRETWVGCGNLFVL